MRLRDVERVRGELDRLRERLDVLVMACGKKDHYTATEHGRYTAAIRRASMDLTRSLADLRRH